MPHTHTHTHTHTHAHTHQKDLASKPLTYTNLRCSHAVRKILVCGRWPCKNLEIRIMKYYKHINNQNHLSCTHTCRGNRNSTLFSTWFDHHLTGLLVSFVCWLVTFCVCLRYQSAQFYVEPLWDRSCSELCISLFVNSHRCSACVLVLQEHPSFKSYLSK